MQDEDETADARRLWFTLPHTQLLVGKLREKQRQHLSDLIAYSSVSEDPSVRSLATAYAEVGRLIKAFEGEDL